MATFKEKFEQLVGDVSVYHPPTVDTDITEYLTATASEVLQIIPDTIAIRHTVDNEQTDATGFNSKNHRVIGVMRNGFEAQEVSLGLKTQIDDSDSIHYRSERTPVYYFDNGTVFVKPDPASSSRAQIKTISYPTVGHGDTSITGFPSTAEYAVVLGACVKYLHDVLSTTLHTNEDVEMAQAIKLQTDSLNQLYRAELERIAGLQ